MRGRDGPPPGRSLVVAVLPLTNLTGDADQDATVVGIAEVVVGALTQIEGVQVLSRSATLAYRDRKQDLAGIARELDASYLLDGVLQRSHNDLRVSLSLVYTPTRIVAWSATYDGAFPAIFDLQSRAAEGVAQALRRSLIPGPPPPPSPPPPPRRPGAITRPPSACSTRPIGPRTSTRLSVSSRPR